MPLVRTTRFESKPMSKGARTVAPNIATTCCSPSRMLCSHGRRSSGATIALSCGNFTRESNMPGFPSVAQHAGQRQHLPRAGARLLRAVQPVPGVAEAGADVGVVVEAAVHGAGEDRHLRVR